MSDERTLFGKPTRYTTLEFHPEKISLKEFCDEIRGSLEAFEKNLQELGARNEKYSKDRYIEDWYETLGAWMEIEEERE
jgi:hypothetical protein